jgi:uncharacterized protein YukE
MPMVKTLMFVPLLLCASPVAAQGAPQVPPALTDPATVQQVSQAAQALSEALLDVRVGGVRAAIDGREATPAERQMTVRDLARRDDPDFDRHLHQQIAAVGPKLQQSMQAVNRALPALMQSLEQAQQSIERAIANLPDPTYPRR